MQVRRSSPGADLFAGSEALRVLVVDDRSDVRASLVDVTRRRGHACHAVGSAAEARPLLASTHFDVALIDLSPKQEGNNMSMVLSPRPEVIRKAQASKTVVPRKELTDLEAEPEEELIAGGEIERGDETPMQP